MPLQIIGIKVSVSTLRGDSQRPEDAPMPTCGPRPFFLEESEGKMAYAVFVIQLLKACVTLHDVMAMAISMQKGTHTSKRFKNESVSAGWYQSWLSQMIEKGTLKRSSGAVPYAVTQEA